MGKAKAIGLLLIGITACYVALAIFIKFVADTTVSTNAVLAASTNMARYPGTSGFLLSAPWILYFVPAIIGIIWLVVILKKREE